MLPSLYTELEGPALAHIVEVLSRVPYLSQIVIGLDRADREQYAHALHYFSRLPQHHRVLWNDGPRLKAIDEQLQTLGLAPRELGKGRNVWYCFGYVQATGLVDAVALHDCDILTYDRALLARLLYPVVHPRFQYDFCKGYYARVAAGKLGGRVCRLLVTPLLRALREMHGERPFLTYLDSFRYPLAGEFSLRTEVHESADPKIGAWRLACQRGNGIGMAYRQVDVATTTITSTRSSQRTMRGLSACPSISQGQLRKLLPRGV